MNEAVKTYPGLGMLSSTATNTNSDADCINFVISYNYHKSCK